MDQIHPNRIRQLLFLAVILFMFWIIGSEMYFMLSSFLGALALYVLMRRWFFHLVMERKWSRPLAASVLMLVSVVVIVLPFAWMITILIRKIEPYISDPRGIYIILGHIDVYLKEHFNLDLFTQKNINMVIGSFTSLAPKLIGSTLVTITNLGIMYFILYFMLVRCTEMELWLRRNLPLNNSNSEKVIAEVREMVKSNAIGIPVLAVVQGIVAMIGYLIFGVNEPVLWGIITGFCSVLPLVGTMLAWFPIAIYQFAVGNTGNGIGLVLWGLLAIGLSDNIFRFWLQKRLADVHPIITVFGVIIGVELFGFIGLIFGPLLISLFVLLVRIYIDEFGQKNNDESESAAA